MIRTRVVRPIRLILGVNVIPIEAPRMVQPSVPGREVIDDIASHQLAPKVEIGANLVNTTRMFVPEIPRAPAQPVPVPGFDPVAAAYQAGKIDADAERRGLSERERFSSPPRPIVIERPVIIEQPRAIISYGRGDRVPEYRHPDSPMSPRSWSETRYSEPSIAGPYIEERLIDPPRDYRPHIRELRPEQLERDFRPEPRDYRPQIRELRPEQPERDFRPEPREFRPEYRDLRPEPRDRDFIPEPREFRSELRDFRPEPREFREFRELRPEIRDVRTESDYFRQEQEAEEYMEPRPFTEKRATEPRIPGFRDPHPHPFAPISLPRRYPMRAREGSGW
ncbi:hypothetical protein G7Y89_g14724 [Cudoniella acicularis]|uniref:Uncharacterized protein n=1 Tax=Cudoniella acicularis TaxID=354080 RepID=A0A8H4VRU5_9HELO|nr:hypothetical protein G7Y89_g14724 [Cudoniella acicularis]